MSKIVAVNIFLSPNEELNDILQENYKLENSDYTLEGFQYIPHISLAMLFIEESRIEELYSDIKELNIPKLILKNIFSIRKGNLHGLSIARDIKLNNLQKNLLMLTQKYKSIGNKESFIIKKFFYEKNIEWVDNFEYNNDYNSKLHITLGKNRPNNIDLTQLDEMIDLPYLTIGQMGNFCAVRKIYHKILLK